MIDPCFLCGILSPKGDTPISRIGNHPLFNPSMIIPEIELYISFSKVKCNHIYRSGPNKGKECERKIVRTLFCNIHYRFHLFEINTEKKKYLKKFTESQDEKKCSTNKLIEIRKEINKRKIQKMNIDNPCSTFTYKILYTVSECIRENGKRKDIYEYRIENVKRKYLSTDLKKFNIVKKYRYDFDNNLGFLTPVATNCKFYAEEILNIYCNEHGYFNL